MTVAQVGQANGGVARWDRRRARWAPTGEETTSEQDAGAGGQGGHHRYQVEGGVRDHIHAQPPGPVRDERQDDPEGGQPRELQRLRVGEAKQDPGDDDGQCRTDPAPEVTEEASERSQQQAAKEQFLKEGSTDDSEDGNDDEPKAVRTPRQLLTGGIELVVEVMDMLRDGDIDGGHQKLATDADRDTSQIDPFESEAEIPYGTTGAADGGGQPGSPEESGPETEQGGHDVPGGGLTEICDGVEAVELSGRDRRHDDENGTQNLATQEAQRPKQEPHPGRTA